jgi:hypothetical protein
LSDGIKAQGLVDLVGAKISVLDCERGEFVSQGGTDALNLTGVRDERVEFHDQE